MEADSENFMERLRLLILEKEGAEVIQMYMNSELCSRKTGYITGISENIPETRRNTESYTVM